jgi:hypothetical protein
MCENAPARATKPFVADAPSGFAQFLRYRLQSSLNVPLVRLGSGFADALNSGKRDKLLKDIISLYSYLLSFNCFFT